MAQKKAKKKINQIIYKIPSTRIMVARQLPSNDKLQDEMKP